MSAQIDFSLEPFFAQSAGEGLVTAMFPHVCDKVGALAERLGADRAFVRLLPCNNKIELVKQYVAFHNGAKLFSG